MVFNHTELESRSYEYYEIVKIRMIIFYSYVLYHAHTFAQEAKISMAYHEILRLLAWENPPWCGKGSPHVSEVKSPWVYPYRE